jgi:hypothetical protein
MTTLHELGKHFRLLSDLDGYAPEEREFLERSRSQLKSVPFWAEQKCTTPAPHSLRYEP